MKIHTLSNKKHYIFTKNASAFLENRILVLLFKSEFKKGRGGKGSKYFLTGHDTMFHAQFKWLQQKREQKCLHCKWFEFLTAKIHDYGIV